MSTLGQRLRALSRLDLRLASRRLAKLGARHAELSSISSIDDSSARPTASLLRLALAAAAAAPHQELPLLSRRDAPELVFQWPGEHYRLLAALVETLEPRSVVEIGTLTGYSALAMLPQLDAGARLTTFDVVAYDRTPGCLLESRDFADGRLSQQIADLGVAAEAERYTDLLRAADLIFIDAAKDGSLEDRLLSHFAAIGLSDVTLLMFDDIKVWNMMAFWRDLALPKLDLTGLGHWSGTGLVEWRQPEGVSRAERE